jgi:hypothetical protein
VRAHAENTRDTRCRKTLGPVHPRACGEHAYTVSVTTPANGSSPPVTRPETVHPRACGEHMASDNVNLLEMRRTLVIAFARSPTPRVHPRAHAENTLAVSVSALPSAVHPRACGEHSLSGRCLIALHGSSPRMRRTLDDQNRDDMLLRFIPAHAENTRLQVVQWHASPVHPRACGEHSYVPPTPPPYNGSSPRMRRTRRPPARGTGA